MPDNADGIIRFQCYVSEQKTLLQSRYTQLLAQDLSRQQWDGCFGRNVLAVLELAYEEALAHLQTLPFDTRSVPVNRGLSDLTKQALAAFDGYVDEFLEFAVDKHRTSCALSNFPDEHKPDKTYINSVRHGIAELWQAFALAVNGHLLNDLVR